MIKCEICGAKTHVIKSHLEKNHPDMTIEAYREKFPSAEIYSDAAKEQIRKKKAKMEEKHSVADTDAGDGQRVRARKPMHEVFNLDPKNPESMSSKGTPIPITTFSSVEPELAVYVPEIDKDYIFDPAALKTVMMGLELNMNTYFYGHAGTGKSTIYEQAHARIGRPMVRIQHSRDTEEAHIVGLYVAKNGETVWQPGILQMCMRYGIDYLADEYDRAMPQVLSLYQSVLEGKNLITKEAPEEWRVVKPHPDFRFMATGNTNGSGDDTGLFVSTTMQDFANYERFSLVHQMTWMPEETEAEMISKKTGVAYDDAMRLVEYATDVRKQVDEGAISSPISPRSLINAARISLLYGNFKRGLTLAFLNRLNSSDRTICEEYMRRSF